MKLKSLFIGLLMGAALLASMGAVNTVIRRLADLSDGPRDTPANGEVLAWNSTSNRTEWAVAGSGSSLTNTFDTNQFTLVNGTNVHFLTAPFTSSVGANLTNAALSGNAWLGAATLTNNIECMMAAGPATNVINFDLNAPTETTNILNGALTMLHGTNGLTDRARTHVRTFWAGGADRTFAIPSTWKTNVNSAVPASITNGTITVMYLKCIGDTSSSANQTNILVSFEFYK